MIKITERGDWLSNKWKGKRRGWIKIHVAIDRDSMNVVCLTISNERRSDTKEFRKFLNPIIGKTSKVYGDRGYNSSDHFNYLHNRKVRARILSRKNARSLAMSSPSRARVVRDIRDKGID